MIVVTHDQRFIEYTNQAIARKLLESGLASKYSIDPFIIKLTEQAHTRYLITRSLTSLVSWR